MHEGHRQRMYSKLNNEDELYDHEVLEMLLFAACPRVNTNPIAHALLERFCSVSEVLNADIEELKSIDGVGESVARFLKTVNLTVKHAAGAEKLVVLKNYGDIKKFVGMRLNGKSEEFLELYFLSKSGRVIRVYSYTSDDRNKVTACAEDLIRNVALARPYGIICAHNHVGCAASPSENDFVFTRELQVICSMNNVKLWDHIIYADNNTFYSFKDEGKLDEIAKKFSVGGIIEWIKTSN